MGQRGNSSSRSKSRQGSRGRQNAAMGAPSQGDRLGRNRPRLFLRPLAPRNSENSLRAANGVGKGGEVAHHHSLPSIQQQRERLGRLSADDLRVLDFQRIGGHSAL